MISLLDAHDHYCFHTPLLNVHKHPDLFHCTVDGCNAAVSPELAHKAGLDDGEKTACPTCGKPMTLKIGQTLAEVHVKLCTDETIHYPEWHKAGKLDTASFEGWKSTLTRDELMGYYKRTPDVHLVAKFTHEETELLKFDRPKFEALMQERVKEAAERSLRYSAVHAHTTTQTLL